MRRSYLSRRQLLARGGAVAAGLGGLALVGCGGDDNNTNTSKGGAAGPPVAGGTLRYSQPGPPLTLNPFKEVSANTAWLIMPAYNGLIKPDPLNQGKTLVSDLATKWEQPDPTTYSFTLPSNAVFHDGTTIGRAMKAQDVAVSLARQIQPGQRRPTPRNGLITALDRIETPNETTVVFKLKRPSAPLLRMLAVGWFVVVPEEVLSNEDQLDTKMIGTGPFMLQQFDSRTGAKLVKNPQYFRAGRPYLDGLDIAIITDANARISAFATGQQDIFPNAMNKSQRQLVRLSDVEWDAPLDSVGGPDYDIAVKTPPYTDVRVRQAVNAVINRQETFVINLPECGMLFKSPMGLTKWALSQEEMAKRQGNRIGAEKPKDIQEAKQLMAAAGFEKGFETEVMIGQSAVASTSLGADAVGLVVAQELGAIGIKANVVKLEYTQFLRRFSGRDYQQASGAISMPAPDPSGLSWIFASNGGRNQTGVSDPEIDRLLEQQEQILEEAARLKAAQELQRKILDSYSSLYLTMEQPCAGNTPRRTYVHNWKVDWSDFRYDGMRLEEIWMEKGKS